MSNEQDLVGKVIKDIDGREYHISSVLSKGGQGIVYRTLEDFLIKINTSPDRELYSERYRWLKKKGDQLPKETRIAFPIAILDGIASLIMSKEKPMASKAITTSKKTNTGSSLTFPLNIPVVFLIWGISFPI